MLDNISNKVYLVLNTCITMRFNNKSDYNAKYPSHIAMLFGKSCIKILFYLRK